MKITAKACQIALLAYLILMLGCQKKPGLAPSSDPLSSIEPPPMGATTYNDELKRELAVLDNLLNDRISNKRVDNVKSALMKGDTKSLPADPLSDDAYLVKIFLAMPELVHNYSGLSENRKLWHRAKLYFLKRRFIEAATHMTEVLKVEPDFAEAKNWRSRAIFFLGNPDLAVKDLSSIVAKNGEKSAAGLDALYLIGAISYESNDLAPQRLNAGIGAWTRYMKLADPDETLKKEITEGIAELNARLKGKTQINELAAPDPFAPNERYSTEKNTILKAFSKEELLLALELAEQALKKSYDDDIATIKARILFKTGRQDDASRQFEEIVTKNNKYAPGFHYRGMVFMMQGRPKDAVSSWQKAIELNKSYADAHGLAQRIAVAQKMIGPEKIDTH